MLDRWWLAPERLMGEVDHADPAEFRRLTRDIYVPYPDPSYWQGTFRDPNDPGFAAARDAIRDRRTLTVELLYGDHLGSQHAIARFALLPVGEDRWLATVSRHWNLDRADPR